MTILVIEFPGSNGAADVCDALMHTLGVRADRWFYNTLIPVNLLESLSAIIIPGGFTYGDRDTAGKHASQSPIIEQIKNLSAFGLPILGICNGFQILTQAGLLPGYFSQNIHRRFESRDIHIRIEKQGIWTSLNMSDTALRMPIAHAYGRYVCDAQTYEHLIKSNLIAARYVPPPAAYTSYASQSLNYNPNGSSHDIAALYNDEGNVLGIMPHPERVCDIELGSSDGSTVFKSLATHLSKPLSIHGAR